MISTATIHPNGRANAKKASPPKYDDMAAARIVIGVERDRSHPDKAVLDRLDSDWQEAAYLAQQDGRDGTEEWIGVMRTRNADRVGSIVSALEAARVGESSGNDPGNPFDHEFSDWPGEPAPVAPPRKAMPIAAIHEWIDGALAAKDVVAFFAHATMLTEIAHLQVGMDPEYEAIELKVKNAAKTSGVKVTTFRKHLDKHAQTAGIGSHARKHVDTSAYNFTDSGNKGRLLALHGHEMLYDPNADDWYVYDGTRWKPGSRMAVERFSGDIAGQIIAEIPPTFDDNIIQAYRDFSEKSESKESRFNAITLARCEVDCLATDFDKDPLLLNVQNGTLHLPTGELRPHRPSDRITKIAATDYDEHAACPQFDRFMKEITNGDVELENYLDRAIGYALSGLDDLHNINIFHGNGRNGKNVLTDCARSFL